MTSSAKQIETWGGNLDKLRAQLTDAKAKQAEAQQARQEAALAAHLGDPAKRKALDKATEQLRAAELEVESLTEAVAQAEAKLVEANDDKRREQERERAAQMRELAERRLAACDVVEQAAQDLAAAIAEYNALGMTLSRVKGGPSGQLLSRWRLDAYLNHTLGTGYVQPAHIKPLSELERSVLAPYLKGPQP